MRVWMELVRDAARGAALLVTIDLPGTRPPATRELELRSAGWFGVRISVLPEHWSDAMPYGKLAAYIPAEYVAAALARGSRRGRTQLRAVFCSEDGSARSEAIDFDVAAHLSAGATALPALREARSRAALVDMGDGALLLLGGRAAGASSAPSQPDPRGALASCELLRPGAPRWERVGPLSVGRAGMAAERLADGSVLCAGGVAADGSAVRRIELFDARRGTWRDAGELLSPRARPAARALADGRVLIADAGACAEVWDPVTRTSQWVEALAPRANTMLLVLPDGRALVAGDAGERAAPDAIWDPRIGAVAPAAPVACRREGHSLTPIAGGLVLVTGGIDVARGRTVATAEIWDPVAGTCRDAGALREPRFGHRAVLRGDGAVCVAGGRTLDEAFLRSSSFRADSFDRWSPCYGVARLVELWRPAHAGPAGAFERRCELSGSIDGLCIAAQIGGGVAVVTASQVLRV